MGLLFKVITSMDTVKNMHQIDYSKKHDKGEMGLTKSMKESAYFSHDSGYDPAVYENTKENWVKIVCMLLLFYLFQGFHWWPTLNWEPMKPGLPRLTTCLSFCWQSSSSPL